MMWIQVATRDGHVVSRHRIEADEARVGRAFDNDVVVDDPHVAPHHLRIAREADGRLVAHDLGSVNGVSRESGGPRAASLPLDAEPGVRIGLTLVRAYDAAHPVPPEVALAPPRADGPWALGLVAAFLAVMGLIVWLTTIVEVKLDQVVPLLLSFLAMVGLWGGFWALIARVFSGRARFAATMRVAAAGALAAAAWGVLTQAAAYGFAWREIHEWRSLGWWALAGAVSWMHLRIIGPKHFGAAAALVCLIAASGASIVVMTRLEKQRTDGLAASLGPLLPPAFRVAPAASLEDFLAGADAARRQVDESRKKEPEGESE